MIRWCTVCCMSKWVGNFAYAAWLCIGTRFFDVAFLQMKSSRKIGSNVASVSALKMYVKGFRMLNTVNV